MHLGPLLLRGRTATTLRVDRWSGDESDDTGRLVANFFAQEDVSFFGGRLRLIPAIGLEIAHTQETEVRDPTHNGALVDVQPNDDPEWLPRIGAILQVAPGLRVKANYGRAYRRPSFRELFLPDQGLIRGNPHLEAEESWSFDVGLQASRPKMGPLRNLRAEAVYFHRDLDNPIEFVQVNSWTFAPVNLDSSRVRGVELSGSLMFSRRLELAASYTHLDAEIRSTGAPLPHRPRNRLFARAALSVAPTRYWLEFTKEDEVPLTHTGGLTADAAHQLDVGVTLQLADLPGFARFGKGLTLSAEWINATDEERVDSLGLPLPGRIWYLRLRGTTR
jgi:outer membrane receptor protein involved in Fe transport